MTQRALHVTQSKPPTEFTGRKQPAVQPPANVGLRTPRSALRCRLWLGPAAAPADSNRAGGRALAKAAALLSRKRVLAGARRRGFRPALQRRDWPSYQSEKVVAEVTRHRHGDGPAGAAQAAELEADGEGSNEDGLPNQGEP